MSRALPSNRQRSRLRNKVWKSVREIGGSDVEIEQDPLGSRYAVNKFGIIVTADDMETMKDTYDRLLVLLKISCWDFEKSGSIFYLTYPPLAPAVAAIHEPYDGPHGARMTIGIN